MALRRRRLWLGMLGLLTLLALAMFLCPGQSRITEANCDCIHKGMTHEEVETLLGGPPRNTALCDAGGVYGYDPPRGDPRYGKNCWWAEDPEYCSISVNFDGDGRVRWAKFEIPQTPRTASRVLRTQVHELRTFLVRFFR
jgi:outer membrane protein assembly factor BamE (lipoprotein component of BamABCDE complex)